MKDEAHRVLTIARRLQAVSPTPAAPSEQDEVPDRPAGVDLYDCLISDPQLRKATRGLFAGAHFAQAVLEGCKYLNRRVRARTGIDTDGADLMRTAFSPSKPLLRLNRLQTESDRSEQRGYMDMLAGLMTGVRNPRAHDDRADDAMAALSLLVAMSHYLALINGATRTRRRTSTRAGSKA